MHVHTYSYTQLVLKNACAHLFVHAAGASRQLWKSHKRLSGKGQLKKLGALSIYCAWFGLSSEKKAWDYNHASQSALSARSKNSERCRQEVCNVCPSWSIRRLEYSGQLCSVEGVIGPHHPRITGQVRSSLPLLSLPTCQLPSNHPFSVPSPGHTGEVGRTFCPSKTATWHQQASFWYHRHLRGPGSKHWWKQWQRAAPGPAGLRNQTLDSGDVTRVQSPRPRHSHPPGTEDLRRFPVLVS